MHHFWSKGSIALVLAAAGASAAGPSGPIVFDASLGKRGKLAGSNGTYAVESSRGKIAGANLFHSFGRFNVPANSTVKFTGPAGVTRVIARVTGATATSILGTLEGVPGASFWLINPNGVLFGKDASVKVDGSFVVSTADAVHFADGAQFAAKDSSPALTIASPSGFGFSRQKPASLSVQGSHLMLSGDKPHALVGGDVHLDDATIESPAGEVALISAAGPGEVQLLTPEGAFAPHISPTTPRGLVSLTGQQFFMLQSGKEVSGPSPDEFTRGFPVIRSAVDVSSKRGGGKIDVVGGDLKMNTSDLLARTKGAADGRGIDINLTGSLNLIGGRIDTITRGDGDAGNVHIEAKSVALRGDYQVVRNSRTRDVILSYVDLSTPIRDLINYVVFRTSINTSSGFDSNFERGGLDRVSNTNDNNPIHGAAGAVDLHSRFLSILDGATIDTTTFSHGDGGDVHVNVGRTADIRNNALIRVVSPNEGSLINAATHHQNRETGIFSRASADLANAGGGGEIFVNAQQLFVRLGGVISSTSRGVSKSGDIHVDTDLLVMNNNRSVPFSIKDRDPKKRRDIRPETSITSRSEGKSLTVEGQPAAAVGSGGSIFIDAHRIELAANPDVAVKSIRQIQITTTTLNDSPAGDIHIRADSLDINGANRDRGARIKATSDAPSKGAAGLIDLDIASISLRNRASVTSESKTIGNGGDIIIRADRLTLKNKSAITAQAGPDSSSKPGQLFGDAGNINLARVGNIILNDSTIRTSAPFSDGGNISILSSGTISLSHGALVTTAAGTERPDPNTHGGNINVNLPLALVIGSGMIKADASGPAGNITIRSRRLIGNDRITAHSDLSLDGAINIVTPDTDIASALVDLPGTLQTPDARLQSCCELKLTRNLSSFVETGRGGLPLAPDGWLPLLNPDLDLAPRPATQP